MDLHCKQSLVLIPDDIKDDEEEIKTIELVNSGGTHNLLLHVALRRTTITDPLNVVLYSEYWLFDLTKLNLPLSTDKNQFLPSMGRTTNINLEEEQLPAMCSFPKGTSKHTIYIGSSISKEVHWENLDLTKATANVELPPATRAIPSTGSHPIGIKTEMAFGRFWRTKLVTFVPKFFLLNEMDEIIKIHQCDVTATTQIVQTVEPKKQVALFWTDAKASKHLQFLVGSDWDWSEGFDPLQIGNYGMSVHHAQMQDKMQFIRVQNIEENGINFIKLSEFSPIDKDERASLEEEVSELLTPFHIINQTSDFVIRFRQVRKERSLKNREHWLTAYPMGIRAYCTESPLDDAKIQLQVAKFSLIEGFQWNESETMMLDLDTEKEHGSVGVGDRQLFVSVGTGGQVRVSPHQSSKYRFDERVHEGNIFSSPAELYNKIQIVEHQLGDLHAAMKCMQAEKLTVMSKLAAVAFGKAKRPAKIPKNQSFLVVQALQARGVPDTYKHIKTSIMLNEDESSKVTTASMDNNGSNVQFVHEQFMFNSSAQRSSTLKIELLKESFFGSKLIGQAEITLNELEDVDDRWIPIMKAKEGAFHFVGEIQLRVVYIPEESNYIAEQVKLIEDMIIERKMRILKLELLHRKLEEQRAHDLELQSSFAAVYENEKRFQPASTSTAILNKYKIKLDLIEGLPEILQASNLINSVDRVLCLITSSMTLYRSNLILADSSSIIKRALDLSQYEVDYYTSQGLVQQGEQLELCVVALTNGYKPQSINLAKAVLPLSSIGIVGSSRDFNSKAENDQDEARMKYEGPEERQIRELKAKPSSSSNVISDVDLNSQENLLSQAEKSEGSLSEYTSKGPWQQRILSVDILVADEVTHQPLSVNMNIVCSFVRESIELNEQIYNQLSTAEVDLLLPGVGLSIIDKTPLELLYISLHGLHASARHSIDKQYVDLQLNRLQIDDQSPDAPFPVMIAHQQNGEPAMDVAVTIPNKSKVSGLQGKTRTAVTNIMSIDLLSLAMAELDVKINEVVIYKLLDFVNSILAPSKHGAEINEKQFIRRYDSLKATTEGVSEMNLKQLNLNEIRVNVTFETKPGLRKVFKSLGDFDPTAYALTFAGALAGGIHDLPIRLPGKELHKVYGTGPEIAKIMLRYYLASLAGQGIKALGYLDIFGQPAGIVSKLGTGVKDIYREPIKGFKEGHLARGMFRGMTAPVKAATSAVFTPAAHIANNVAKGAAAISGDEKFARQDENRSIEPEGAREGASTGAKAVVQGFEQGIKDPFTRSMRLGKKEGAGGYVKGAMGGVVGLATKPVAGVAKGVGLTLHGVANQADSSMGKQEAIGIQPVRPRRKLIPGCVITEYQPDPLLEYPTQSSDVLDANYDQLKPKRELLHRGSETNSTKQES